ncbi:MAG: dihydropteroate synthase [Proteobacteria bacterium]|nr:dihydropteroate synthase [Pseudomonadota bacterium]MBU4036632.1 dihydropteroate synthase [Pseudomonadota bacterium]
MKSYEIAWGSHRLVLGNTTRIMGIVNVTPDSFSDGGIFFNTDSAVAHGEKLVEDGADILDIGGESSRPFSEPVSEKEEIRRVVPVIKKLANRISVPISIDTTKSVVAQHAIDAGAGIINDISALHSDKKLAEIAAKHGVPVILMHMKGTPENMQLSPHYDNLLEEIKKYLKDAAQIALNSGIDKSKIIIDPGIGFGKTIEHNLLLIKNLHELADLDMPVLIGPSRKAFIRKIITNKSGIELKPHESAVETGTQAAVAAAVFAGAHIVRVHDVANTVSTVRIIDAIKNAGEFRI